MKRLLIVAGVLVTHLVWAASHPGLASDNRPMIESLVAYTDETYGLTSVVPSDWTHTGNGIHSRSQSPGDPTLIVQQSAPVKPDALLQAILPQLALTEPPDPSSTYAGMSLQWTLYQVEVHIGAIELNVALGIAGTAGRSYLVLLQSDPSDFDGLYVGVFIPVLDALTPLTDDIRHTSAPYSSEEVHFNSDGAVLAGTLTLPPSTGPHAAVVLVTGSGAQDRDSTFGGGIAFRPFRLLADRLTRHGIAVLRYDERGVGASTGTFSTATTADFASDAAAAIQYLHGREAIDPEQIGLIGHSEGGLIAAMLGARNDALDFIIALAGPAVSGREVLLLQNRRSLEAEGAKASEIATQVAFVQSLYAAIGDEDALIALIYAHLLDQLEAVPDEELALLGDVESYARALAQSTAQEYTTPWFTEFLAYDPAIDWARTTVPVLAVYGGKDVQVAAGQNIPALEDALRRAGNVDFEITVLPDANHLFQQAVTGAVSEYAELPAAFDPALVPTIVDWLQAHGYIEH